MTAGPLIDIAGVSKAYGGLRPLRVKGLQIGGGDRLALAGLDAGAAETLVNLITGASLPDEGTVRVAGHDTRGIATDTEWLSSLDRFGIVTHRAVLIGKLPIDQNLALPLTLAIDPMSDDTRAAVERLADRVRLSRSRLAEAASTLSPAEVVAVHLARALASGPGGPQFLILEHPTAQLNDRAASESLGRVLREAVPAGTGWLALTEDSVFARASGAVELRLQPASGEISREKAWWRFGR
jgi:predicted ABC-type transport system involved in lysophospholipase L1 biosynthesis ATPase subunit